MKTLIKVRPLSDHPVVPQLLTVIASENDERFVVLTCFLQQSDDPANLMVDFRHETIVCRPQLTHGTVVSGISLRIPFAVFQVSFNEKGQKGVLACLFFH